MNRNMILLCLIVSLVLSVLSCSDTPIVYEEQFKVISIREPIRDLGSDKCIYTLRFRNSPTEAWSQCIDYVAPCTKYLVGQNLTLKIIE